MHEEGNFCGEDQHESEVGNLGGQHQSHLLKRCGGISTVDHNLEVWAQATQYEHV